MLLPFDQIEIPLSGPAAGPTLIWITLLGAAIGSFLNVVVYRLPRGMSLSRPGSACPNCNHPIRWYDNIPVFGWIKLRGRCRDCQHPISPRYPIIEAIVAAIFLGVAMVIPPVLRWVAATGLLTTLLAMVLIYWDGHVPPARLFLPVLVLGLLLPHVQVAHVSEGRAMEVDWFASYAAHLMLVFECAIIAIAIKLLIQLRGDKRTRFVEILLPTVACGACLGILGLVPPAVALLAYVVATICRVDHQRSLTVWAGAILVASAFVVFGVSLVYSWPPVTNMMKAVVSVNVGVVQYLQALVNSTHG